MNSNGRIWHYDSLSGILVCQGYADPNPLEPGQWLLPAFATETPPLENMQNGFVAAYRSGGWTAIPQPDEEPPEQDPEQPLRRAVRRVTIIRRMSDAEIDAFPSALQTAPTRFRLLWEAATEVWVDEAEPFFVSALGAARAAELLAP